MANQWTPEQEAAMSIKGKTLLVSAAAGSGKTSVLTERIIRLLTDREHPADLSRMLIVTFTRASAADLKSKIAKALTAALAEHPGDEHLTRQILSLGSAQISTIDSFFQKAVRASFDELDLPAAFRTVDSTEVLPLCMDVLDGLLETHYAKSAVQTSVEDPLARIKENAFAEAMDHLMSGRSDGKLDFLLLKFYERFASYPQGIGLLHDCAKRLIAEADGEFFRSQAGKSIHNYILEQISSHLAFLKNFSAKIESDPDLYLKLCGILTSDTDFCNAMLRALESNSYKEVQRVAYTFITGRFPTIRGDVPDVVLTYKAWRNKFKESVTKKIQPYLQWPAEVLPEQFKRTASLCEVLYGFYTDYEARILAEKKARGILEHNDIRAALYRLLTLPDGSPSPAAKALASQYDAVYIDEYQDVDFLQDSIFSQIGGNRRFMVGDIKQSIYGFRGSEPSVFAGYRRTYPLYTEQTEDHTDGVCVFMSNNFRCNEPVIQFTNQICSFLFSACESSIGYRPQDDLVFSKSKNEKAASVAVEVFDTKPRKKGDVEEQEEDAEELAYGAEAAWVAKEIERLLQRERLDNGTPISPSDIAILVRAKSHGIEFSKALEALGIPVVAEAATNLMQEPLTVDLLNLLRAIDNPYRDLPLSEYLLSELGGFTLEELTEIRRETPDTKALYDALSAKANSEEETPLSQKCQVFCAWLENLRESAATLSADRFLRLLYLDEKLIPYQGDPVLLYLYEQARIHQRAAFCGLYAFLDAMTKLQSSEKVSAEGFRQAKQAVTVMTVHHSKGLEFPVVFLCASGKHFNKDDLKSSLMFHRNVGCTSKLYNPELGESEETALRLATRIETEAEQTEESIRTLYVALTRSRERLYVTGTLGGSRDSALTSAELVLYGDRASILECNSYLAWILAALQEKNDASLPYTLNFHSHIPIDLNAKEEACEDSAVQAKALEADTSIASRYAKIIRAQQSFDYPLACLRGLPTKAAASKLAPDLLDRLSDDTDENAVSEAQLALMESAQPTFDELLLANSQPSASDIGTATHSFLQFCSFARLANTDVDTEIATLVTLGFISESAARLIDKKQINAFCQSGLMEELLSAKKILREQTFQLFVPFSELTSKKDISDVLSEHTLFVQGSIDLLIETVDGELILVDYKTDRIHQEEYADLTRFHARMRAAHGAQLSYYQSAVKQLFSKDLTKTWIYSLPLGDVIEL